MRRGPRAILILVTLCLPGGCRHFYPRDWEKPPTSQPVADPVGVVFCADGAGGYGGTTKVLRDALAAAQLRYDVEMVDWSHGMAKVYLDHSDLDNIQAWGCRLRDDVLARAARHPGKPIYLMSHSAGTAVVLRAAGGLPPDTLEGIILLAPSVAPAYDLRPALRATRGRIDVFTSSRDFWALGIGTRLYGTTDGPRGPAAGLNGFRPLGDTQEDACLYAKLRQHPWHPSQAAVGHLGGHYGTYRPGFMQTSILPLLR